MESRHAGNRRKNGGAKKKGGQRAPNLIPRPLAIGNVALTHNVKLRFVTTGTVANAITYQNLLDTILVSTTATAGYQLFDLVKVRGIELWCYNPTGVATVSVHFIGRSPGVVGDDRAHTDTSMGIEPAYLKIRPNPKSQASMFQTTSSAVAFNVYCPIATVIDLSLSYRGAMEGNAPTSAQQALVAATPGLIWYRGFDGLATATTKFIPQGTPQII